MTEPSATHRFRKRRVIALAVACLVVGVLVATITGILSRRVGPEPEARAHDVPLGVEEAVIIRYHGPRLVARPYRRGASVNLRIADCAHRGEVGVYDVRYVVGLPGEFDLKDYFASADGNPLDGLPSFKVRGLESLTKDIETRIREIEDVGVHLAHSYYETLAGLGALWVLWLVGLVWLGRPKRAPKPLPLPPEPSLADQIRWYFDALDRGALSVEQQARLEILLLRHWRGRLDMHVQRMAVSCRQIQQHPQLGPAYEALQAWLHAPAAAVGPADLVRLCRPIL